MLKEAQDVSSEDAEVNEPNLALSGLIRLP